MNLSTNCGHSTRSDPGRWPLPVRVGAVAVWLRRARGRPRLFPRLESSKQPDLRAQRRPRSCSCATEFKTKHAKAVNLEVYKQQLKDIERSFGALLRQLPGKTEVPNLLVDISQTGLAAGLEEKLFQPAAEQKKDFYAELPIKIRLTGSYHQFGEFVSGIAALPRIVTLHDIDIKVRTARTPYDELTLDLTAKTYRYLDEEEIAAAEAEKTQASRAGRRADRRRQITGWSRTMQSEPSSPGSSAPRSAVRCSRRLTACSSADDELERFIDDTKKEPGGRVEPLPEVKPYETFVYAASEPALAVPAGRPRSAPAARRRCARTRKRNREFLEQFSLDTLKMVGTLRLGGTHLRLGADQGRPRASRGRRQLPRPGRRQDHRDHALRRSVSD